MDQDHRGKHGRPAQPNDAQSGSASVPLLQFCEKGRVGQLLV